MLCRWGYLRRRPVERRDDAELTVEEKLRKRRPSVLVLGDEGVKAVASQRSRRMDTSAVQAIWFPLRRRARSCCDAEFIVEAKPRERRPSHTHLAHADPKAEVNRSARCSSYPPRRRVDCRCNVELTVEAKLRERRPPRADLDHPAVKGKPLGASGWSRCPQGWVDCCGEGGLTVEAKLHKRWPSPTVVGDQDVKAMATPSARRMDSSAVKAI